MQSRKVRANVPLVNDTANQLLRAEALESGNLELDG